MKNNNTNEERQKIKKDILEIINQNNVGTCLCGRGESCDICSPSQSYRNLTNNLRNYLNGI